MMRAKGKWEPETVTALVANMGSYIVDTIVTNPSKINTY